MAKINYQYEKRQKDLAKKKKREEKRLKRLNKNIDPEEEPAKTTDDINTVTDETPEESI